MNTYTDLRNTLHDTDAVVRAFDAWATEQGLTFDQTTTIALRCLVAVAMEEATSGDPPAERAATATPRHQAWGVAVGTGKEVRWEFRGSVIPSGELERWGAVQ